jgi:hypothetical protein
MKIKNEYVFSLEKTQFLFEKKTTLSIHEFLLNAKLPKWRS